MPVALFAKMGPEVPLLGPVVAQRWDPMVRIVGTHCCATMAWDRLNARLVFHPSVTSDHISATTTYVMWHGKHLWNVSVLQRVHLFNLVILHPSLHLAFQVFSHQNPVCIFRIICAVSPVVVFLILLSQYHRLL
jgi:hypothetical protein